MIETLLINDKRIIISFAPKSKISENRRYSPGDYLLLGYLQLE